MKGLLFFFYGVNICWLWGCLVYMFVLITKQYEGKPINKYLEGTRLRFALGMVFFWLCCTVYSGFDCYTYLEENQAGVYAMLLRMVIEFFNASSSICCTLLILGYGIKKEK